MKESLEESSKTRLPESQKTSNLAIVVVSRIECSAFQMYEILTSSTFAALMYSLDLELVVALKEEIVGFRGKEEVLNNSKKEDNCVCMQMSLKPSFLPKPSIYSNSFLPGS